MDYQAQTERFIRSEEPEGGFVNAMTRGVDSTQMAGYGFVKAVGDYLGEDWISRWAKKGIDRNLQEILSNPAKVHSWDDVDSLADFGTYFIETIGEQVPQLLIDIPLVMMGNVGGAGAVAGRRTMLAGIGKAAKRAMGEKAFAQFKKHSRKALIGNLYVQSAGETQLELEAEGVNAPGAALLGGIPKAALDAYGLEKFLGVASRAAVNPRTMLERSSALLKAAGVAAGVEGMTEAVQTAIDKVIVNENAVDYDLFSTDNLKEIREAAIKGALVGGTLSAGIDAISQYSQYSAEQAVQRDQELADAVQVAAEARAKEPPVRHSPSSTIHEPTPPESDDEDDLAASSVSDVPRSPSGSGGAATGIPKQSPQAAASGMSEINSWLQSQQASMDQLSIDYPIAEPQSQIDAQARAVAEGRKPAMEITRGSPLPSPGIIPDNATVIPTENGHLVTMRPEVADNFLKMPNVGEALYGNPTGKTHTDGTVVVGRDADGQIVYEEATNGTRLATSIGNAQQVAGEQGTVELSDPQRQVQERAENHVVETVSNAVRDPNIPNAADRIRKLFSQFTSEEQLAIASNIDKSPEIAEQFFDLAMSPEETWPTQQQITDFRDEREDRGPRAQFREMQGAVELAERQGVEDPYDTNSDDVETVVTDTEATESVGYDAVRDAQVLKELPEQEVVPPESIRFEPLRRTVPRTFAETQWSTSEGRPARASGELAGKYTAGQVNLFKTLKEAQSFADKLNNDPRKPENVTYEVNKSWHKTDGKWIYRKEERNGKDYFQIQRIENTDPEGLSRINGRLENDYVNDMLDTAQDNGFIKQRQIAGKQRSIELNKSKNIPTSILEAQRKDLEDQMLTLKNRETGQVIHVSTLDLTSYGRTLLPQMQVTKGLTEAEQKAYMRTPLFQVDSFLFTFASIKMAGWDALSSKGKVLNTFPINTIAGQRQDTNDYGEKKQIFFRVKEHYPATAIALDKGLRNWSVFRQSKDFAKHVDIVTQQHAEHDKNRREHIIHGWQWANTRKPDTKEDPSESESRTQSELLEELPSSALEKSSDVRGKELHAQLVGEVQNVVGMFPPDTDPNEILKYASITADQWVDANAETLKEILPSEAIDSLVDWGAKYALTLIHGRDVTTNPSVKLDSVEGELESAFSEEEQGGGIDGKSRRQIEAERADRKNSQAHQTRTRMLDRFRDIVNGFTKHDTAPIRASLGGFSETVSDFLGGIHQYLNLQFPVDIVYNDAETVDALFYNGVIDKSTYDSIVNQRGKFKAAFVPVRGKALILVNPEKRSESNLLWQVGHEMGHAIQYFSYANASNQAKHNLEKAFAEVADKYTGKDGFAEWYADQISAYFATQGANTRTKTHGFFKRIASKLKKLFQMTAKAAQGSKGHRFKLNPAFKRFVEYQRAKNNFRNADTFGEERFYYYDGLGVNENDLGSVKERAKKYRDVMFGEMNLNKGGIRRLFQPFITGDTEMRVYSTEIADMFYWESNKKLPEGAERPLIQETAARWHMWKAAVDKLAKNTSLADMKEAFLDLSAEKPVDQLTPTGKKVRELLDKFYDSELSMLPEMGRLDNYFIRKYDTNQIMEREGEFRQVIRNYFDRKTSWSDAAKDRAVDGVLSSIYGLNAEHVDTMTPGRGNIRTERELNDPELSRELTEKNFINTNPLETLYSYLHKSVERSVFEQRFGAMREFRNENGDPEVRWVADAKLKDKLSEGISAYFEHARRMGFDSNTDETRTHATSGNMEFKKPGGDWVEVPPKAGELSPYAAERIRTIIKGYYRKLGLKMDPKLRNMQSTAMALTNWITLSLSAVSSLVEIPVMMAALKDFTNKDIAWASIKQYVSKDRAEMLELYEDLGFADTHATSQILADMYGYSNESVFAQKANNLLFKLNGNEALVKMFRTVSAHMGTQFMLRHAKKASQGDATSKRYLESLGIDYGTVLAWERLGKPIANPMDDSVDVTETFMIDGTGEEISKSSAQVKQDMFKALHRFVDSAVMRPNAAERPVWGTDPRFALLMHLKAFAFSLHKNVFSGLYREVKAKHGEDAASMWLYMAGVTAMFFGVAALANELREEIQYALGGEWRPSNSMSNGEYVWHLATNRIGIFANYTMWTDALMNKYNQSVGAFSLVPSVSVVDRAMNEPDMFSKALRVTPVVAQNYGLRKVLKEMWYGDQKPPARRTYQSSLQEVMERG